MIAIVIGGTGLVGRQLIKELLNDTSCKQVKVFSRRSLEIKHEKLYESLVDFNHPEEWRDDLLGDVLFSCLGTTLKQAGGKTAQYQVDYHYQYQVARICQENGVETCVLLSSPGARPESKVFYTRMKGELDRDVAKLSFKHLVLIKPSILAGARDVRRAGEAMALGLMKAISWIPFIKPYRPITGQQVARAMIWAAKNPVPHQVVEYSLGKLFEIAASD